MKKIEAKRSKSHTISVKMSTNFSANKITDVLLSWPFAIVLAFCIPKCYSSKFLVKIWASFAPRPIVKLPSECCINPRSSIKSQL